MQDYVVRAIAAEGSVRAFAASTTNIVREARELHSLSPVASAALGRTMTGAAMMAKLLKGEKDTMTIQVKGDGPLGGLVVITDPQSNVRGYVYNPDVDLPLNEKGKLDVSAAIGKGYLNVIKDLGLREPYIGYVRLVSGEIAEDLTYYFAYSEQIPTVIALGVLIDPDENVAVSGGYMLQLMPGAEEQIIDFLENKVASLPPVTKLLSDGKTPEEILEIILGEKGLKITDTSPCSYRCNCSRERMERNLLSLGKKEIADLIAEQEGAETQCHFCNTKYQFTGEDLRNIMNSIDEEREEN